MTNIKQSIRNYLKKYREHLPLKYQRKYFKCVTINPSTKQIKGRVLMSYALTSAGLKDNHPLFNYHSGPWESNKIISIFISLGYIVDCIHHTNKNFIPKKQYDIIFGCTGELYRLAAYAPGGEKALKIWHPTTSFISYNNNRELERISHLEKRHPGMLYMPKRQEPYEQITDKLMNIVDHCVLIGSKRTLHTYPKEFHEKITLVPVSTPSLSYKKSKINFVPRQKHFLWHFGHGAVHKGLDLLLEVFKKHPEWVLHITGSLNQEPDFMKIYHTELTGMKNIQYHGYLSPNSKEFIAIVNQCFAFIAPSCSESISVACATMMQIGLYPIVSRDTGIELPAGAGMYFEDMTHQEIEEKIKQIYSMKESDLSTAIEKTQAHALNEYTREKFEEKMRSFLSKIIKIYEKDAI